MVKSYFHFLLNYLGPIQIVIELADDLIRLHRFKSNPHFLRLVAYVAACVAFAIAGTMTYRYVLHIMTATNIAILSYTISLVTLQCHNMYFDLMNNLISLETSSALTTRQRADLRFFDFFKFLPACLRAAGCASAAWWLIAVWQIVQSSI